MSTNNKGTVFIIDDDDDFRESVTWLLQSEDLQTQAFASAKTFLDYYQDEIGCILLDVRMPDINGLSALQVFKEKKINIPVIIISGHGDIPMAVSAMKHGASDFIEKPFDDEHLLKLVNQCLSKAEEQAQSQSSSLQVQQVYERLSRREKEVMTLVVEGKANREIAEELGISPKTVEVHRSRVMNKMEAESLPDLVKKSAILEDA